MCPSSPFSSVTRYTLTPKLTKLLFPVAEPSMAILRSASRTRLSRRHRRQTLSWREGRRYRRCVREDSSWFPDSSSKASLWGLPCILCKMFEVCIAIENWLYHVVYSHGYSITTFYWYNIVRCLLPHLVYLKLFIKNVS